MLDAHSTLIDDLFYCYSTYRQLPSSLRGALLASPNNRDFWRAVKILKVVAQHVFSIFWLTSGKGQISEIIGLYYEKFFGVSPKHDVKHGEANRELIDDEGPLRRQ